jgi:peptidylprolyl isomerase
VFVSVHCHDSGLALSGIQPEFPPSRDPKRAAVPESLPMKVLVPTALGMMVSLALAATPAFAKKEEPATPAPAVLSTVVDTDLSHEPDDVLLLDLSNGGRVAIRLMSKWAPEHVTRIKTLARQGFYNGVTFHRVIDGFMAQTGDPTGTGQGGSQLPDLKPEFNSVPHLRGTVSMARTNDPNSANSQFFIVFDDATFLDRQYTVWGNVIEGMENVDALPKGEPPREPGAIKSITLG